MEMDEDWMKIIGGLFALALVIAFIAIGPIFTIWAVNHLAHMEWLRVDFPTWLSVAWLHLLLAAGRRQTVEVKK